MEFGVQHYIGLLAAIFLICLGLYLILGPIKFAANPEGHSKIEASINSRGFININFIVITRIAGSIALMFGSISSWQLITGPDEMYYEQAKHKSSGVSPQTASLTEPLLKGLDYEVEGHSDLALVAYREAYDDKTMTREARAFILSRIAQLRFEDGFSKEALQEARFAIELGRPKPLYLHTLARILIDQCNLDEAQQQLSQIQGDNAVTADLRIKIDDSQGICPGS